MNYWNELISTHRNNVIWFFFQCTVKLHVIQIEIKTLLFVNNLWTNLLICLERIDSLHRIPEKSHLCFHRFSNWWLIAPPCDLKTALSSLAIFITFLIAGQWFLGFVCWNCCIAIIILAAFIFLIWFQNEISRCH